MNLTTISSSQLGPVSFILWLLSVVGKIAYWVIRIAMWVLRRLLPRR